MYGYTNAIGYREPIKTVFKHFDWNWCNPLDKDLKKHMKSEIKHEKKPVEKILDDYISADEFINNKYSDFSDVDFCLRNDSKTSEPTNDSSILCNVVYYPSNIYLSTQLPNRSEYHYPASGCNTNHRVLHSDKYAPEA